MSYCVLPSVTTSCKLSLPWQQKLLQVRELSLAKFALFLTGLSFRERAQCYAILNYLKADLQFSIPFIHATSDMREEEYWFLHSEFGTERFNIHPLREFPVPHPLSSKVRNLILIENATECGLISQGDIAGFGGVCIDLSHLEEVRLTDPRGYMSLENLIFSNKIGANHISAVRERAYTTCGTRPIFSCHTLRCLTEFKYIEKYPLEFFAKFVAIELNEAPAEQLPVVKMVEEIIERKIAESILMKAA